MVAKKRVSSVLTSITTKSQRISLRRRSIFRIYLFEVIDASVRVAVPMRAWEEKTPAAIKRSECVIITHLRRPSLVTPFGCSDRQTW